MKTVFDVGHQVTKLDALFPDPDEAVWLNDISALETQAEPLPIEVCVKPQFAEIDALSQRLNVPVSDYFKYIVFTWSQHRYEVLLYLACGKWVVESQRLPSLTLNYFLLALAGNKPLRPALEKLWKQTQHILESHESWSA